MSQYVWQSAYCARLFMLAPAIERTYTLVQQFATMVRQRLGEALDQWLCDVAASGITELKTFAQGLQCDYAAVKAGLTLAWSNEHVAYCTSLH
jgi:transposase